MLTRILCGTIFILGISGCATTQNRATQSDQLQTRVAELEKKVEEKDSEIVDLQYEVKDLSSKLEGSKSGGGTETESAAPTIAVKSNDDVIRANTTAEKVQAALKSAGFYSGKIDGKVGSGTRAAIVAFQKSKGLNADGVVGRKTWDSLKQYLQ